MTDDLLELADKLWNGEVTVERVNPVTTNHDLGEVGPGMAFIPAFGNISAFAVDGGLVLVDTGNRPLARTNFERIRHWTGLPLRTAVYTHGHIDHVSGLGPFEDEAGERGWDRPHVVAHRDVPRRFERYVLTAGYNSVINQRQFRLPGLQWPTDYRYPDETYDDRLDLDAGGERFELHHALGETDDHTWVWVPGRRTLCAGDLFIWASPNCGNPQKVQRYPREWADALREMAGLPAELLLPGHGWPIVGAERVQQALTDTADLLDSLVDQALALMNGGATLDDVLHTVTPPPELLGRPYLRPVYDEPEFVVRNIWRLYGGWYDGNPANLKPAPEAQLARELAELAGGAERLAERATALAAAGDLRLAGHLAQLAAQAAPGDAGVHRVRAEVFAQRAAAELSTMSRGVFSWAADESRARSGSEAGQAPPGGEQGQAPPGGEQGQAPPGGEQG
jgi:alkyl sulfatase BDS1-like metallo-beta-lactamase superfamily hydrolase